MADSAVSIHQGSGTLAQAVLSSAPEGMLIAPVWKRVAAFMLDVVLLTLVLHFMTGQRLLVTLPNFGLLTEGLRYSAGFLVSWTVFFIAHYLYFKYTGRAFGRSFAQRGFRIAIVHDNGTLLEATPLGPSSIWQTVLSSPDSWCVVVWSSGCSPWPFEGRRVQNLIRCQEPYRCGRRLVTPFRDSPSTTLML